MAPLLQCGGFACKLKVLFFEKSRHIFIYPPEACELEIASLTTTFNLSVIKWSEKCSHSSPRIREIKLFAVPVACRCTDSLWPKKFEYLAFWFTKIHIVLIYANADYCLIYSHSAIRCYSLWLWMMGAGKLFTLIMMAAGGWLLLFHSMDQYDIYIIAQSGQFVWEAVLHIRKV